MNDEKYGVAEVRIAAWKPFVIEPFAVRARRRFLIQWFVLVVLVALAAYETVRRIGVTFR